MEKRSKQILEYLDQDEREIYISELLDAVEFSIKDNDTSKLVECLDKWEAVADLNSIPGLKKRVWDRFKHYKKLGRIH